MPYSFPSVYPKQSSLPASPLTSVQDGLAAAYFTFHRELTAFITSSSPPAHSNEYETDSSCPPDTPPSPHSFTRILITHSVIPPTTPSSIVSLTESPICMNPSIVSHSNTHTKAPDAFALCKKSISHGPRRPKPYLEYSKRFPSTWKWNVPSGPQINNAGFQPPKNIDTATAPLSSNFNFDFTRARQQLIAAFGLVDDIGPGPTFMPTDRDLSSTGTPGYFDAYAPLDCPNEMLFGRVWTKSFFDETDPIVAKSTKPRNCRVIGSERFPTFGDDHLDGEALNKEVSFTEVMIDRKAVGAERSARRVFEARTDAVFC